MRAFVETDLNTLISEVLVDLEEEVRTKNAQISIDKFPLLSVNPGLMKPLFQNLLSNALKYSKKDTSPIITITNEINTLVNGRQSKEKERYCRILIQDNGIGFDQKYAEEIFGMFKRLHHNTEFQGTGIGLALCKKIVEQHKGYISARSKVNEGSTFIISLPMQQKEEAVPVDSATQTH